MRKTFPAQKQFARLCSFESEKSIYFEKITFYLLLRWKRSIICIVSLQSFDPNPFFGKVPFSFFEKIIFCLSMRISSFFKYHESASGLKLFRHFSSSASRHLVRPQEQSYRSSPYSPSSDQENCMHAMYTFWEAIWLSGLAIAGSRSKAKHKENWTGTCDKIVIYWAEMAIQTDLDFRVPQTDRELRKTILEK